MALTDGSQTLLTAFALNEAGPWVQWNGGRGMCSVYGTFGGASAKMQYSPDNGVTASDLDATNGVATSTAPGFEFACAPALIRLIVSGGTAASISAKVNRL